jgi:hypothetical protein
MLNTIGEKWCLAYVRKAVYMQRIADAVQRGHERFAQGKVSRDNTVHFYNKMCGLLPLFETDNKNLQRAWRARKEGSATGRILFWLPSEKSDHVHYTILMSKSGELETPPGITFKNVLTDTMSCTHYELTRVSKDKIYDSKKVKVPVKKEGDEVIEKPVKKSSPRRDTHTWTWRINKTEYEETRDRIVHAIKDGRHKDVKELIDFIFGTVGFSAARAQAKRLVYLVKKSWAEYGEGEPPKMPGILLYIQKLSDHERYTRIYKDGSIQKPGQVVEAYFPPAKGIPGKTNPKAGRQSPVNRDLSRLPNGLLSDPSIDIGRWQDDPDYRESVKKAHAADQAEPGVKKKIETRPSAGDDYYQRADLEHNHGQIRLPGT